MCLLTSRTTVGPLAVAPGRAENLSAEPRCTAGGGPVDGVGGRTPSPLGALTGGRTRGVRAESDGYPHRLSDRLLFRYDAPDVGQSVDDPQSPTGRVARAGRADDGLAFAVVLDLDPNLVEGSCSTP